MTPHTRLRSLAPRLALLFAVISCVLGLGQAGAAAQDMPTGMGMGGMPSGAAADPGHAAQQVARTAQSPDDLARTAQAGEGHSRHGSDAGHTKKCMSTPAVAAFGAIAFAGAALLVTPALSAPLSRMRAAVLAVSYPRPPDLAALCVQRI